MQQIGLFDTSLGVSLFWRSPVRFEDYVVRQGPSLLRLAYVLTNDRHRAEDLTQTVLTTAFSQWGRVVAADHPDAYVRRMLVNAHLDWYRRRSSHERPTLMDTSALGVVADPAEGVVTRDGLRQALALLAPRARTVLVLRFYADLDDAAIADAMGVSMSTVRATTSRALETLRSSGRVRALEEAP